MGVGRDLDSGHQLIDRRGDPVEDRLGIDAEENDEDDQRGDDQPLGPVEISGLGVDRIDRAVEAC